ncbi:hypothetical protein Plim_3555 [Planctopirus limnophila DSM 3776]|uniref:Uncharacterized protein n=1 Tax=Planctopirus limnophila (strain ATCC 43296 / DSM 3776 / IFAM 1008 / Mu 290) TaxID=521674 RepID=D5SVK8_PLAL2|nr:hypothetical protein [Planctopirus limnophila]ADG69368.1 hypothetical protein Plim_3555 [Planctopirus limnophila DSM 3776]
MPSPAQLQHSLIDYWQSVCPDELPTLWPGRKADPQSWQQWCELRVDSWTQPIQRLGRSHIACVITLRLFVRQIASSPEATLPSLHSRLEQLQTVVTQAWHEQTIPIVDDLPENSASIIGYLRVADLTSRSIETSSPTLLGREFLITARTS